MVSCSLRWSRIEFAFISTCHLVALLSVFQAEARLWLNLLLTAAVLASFSLYLRDRLQTFYRLGQGSVAPAQPKLLLARQFTRLDYRGRVYETAPPSVTYFSEFLLVLRLRGGVSEASTNTVHLVLWPDSLTPAEDRRLRRYLRFELPQNLQDR